MLIRLVEFGLILIVMSTIFSQFIVPAIRNEPLFPFFRRSSDRENRELEIAAINKRIDELVAWRKETESINARLSELESSSKKESP